MSHHPHDPSEDPRIPGEPEPAPTDPYSGTPYATPPPDHGVPGYGAPPGAYSYGPPMLPAAPGATASLVLGAIGLIGIVLCGGATLILSPFAWVMGSRAVRAIDAEPGRYSGRDQANTGRITGIIGTVLLLISIVALAALIGFFWMQVESIGDFERTYEFSPSPSP